MIWDFNIEAEQEALSAWSAAVVSAGTLAEHTTDPVIRKKAKRDAVAAGEKALASLARMAGALSAAHDQGRKLLADLRQEIEAEDRL